MSGTTGIQRVMHSDRQGTGLEDWEAMDPDSLESGAPVQRGAFCDEDEATGYSAGVWDCTPFVDAKGPYPVDEFMLLLEGTIEMRLPEGGAVTVKAGEAFVIPKGFECQWAQPEYVRKVFMIVDDPIPEGTGNPTLELITKPPMSGASPSGPLENAETWFQNAGGQMSVVLRSHAGGTTAPAPTPSHVLFHVLEGAVTLTVEGTVEGKGERFVAGETGYAKAGTSYATTTEAGTRLIEARYRP
ncbi:MAG: cupin domain-containing protein [Pseudomonadota bacterium]